MENFKIELTEKDLGIILNAITQLPWNVANDTINKIMTQQEEQKKKAEKSETKK